MNEEQKKLADKLTKLQLRTVLNMVAGLSQREAYYAAGGTAKSPESADVIVCKMLRETKVKAFHDSLIDSVARDAVITRQQALERLSQIAMTNVSDVAIFRTVEVGEDKDGNPVRQSVWELKDAEDIEGRSLSAIAELSSSGSGLKFKLHSPLAAIKQLADMEGWEAPKKLEIDEKRPPLLSRRVVNVEDSEDGAATTTH